MTRTYGFDSKRDAQNKRLVGSTCWDAEKKDHSDPTSLMICTANGPVQYNASGPTYWGKDVTYEVASESQWAAARIREIERSMSTLAPHWEVKEPNRDEREDRAAYAAGKAEIERLKSILAA